MNARDPNLPLQPDEASQLGAYAQRRWDEAIVPALADYIAIPAKSPMFDADWAAHGHIDRVVRDAAAWVEARKLPGLTLEVVRLEGRTPVIFFEIESSSGRRAAPSPDAPPRGGDAAGVPGANAQAGSTDTVLMYGHLDKQPEFTGWRNDLGPWTPKY